MFCCIRKSKAKKPGKPKDATENDIIKVQDPKSTDIVIPIIGPAGVGKSTFINAAVGSAATSINHNLVTEQQEIQPVIVAHPYDVSRRLIFVDTPGFNDTEIDDTEILRRIGVWLALSYNKEMKVGGIIYLYEISQARMLGASRQNFVMFNRLCGEKAVKGVVFATTKWGDVKHHVAIQREQQLFKYWKETFDQGSHLTRFTDTRESAWAIVDIILQNDPINSLQIQRELADHQMRTPETKAGISLRNPLQALLMEQKALAQRLKNESQLDEESRKKYEEVQKRIRSTRDQIQALKDPLGKRIKTVFSP